MSGVPLALSAIIVLCCLGSYEPAANLGAVTGTIHSVDGKPLQDFTVRIEKFTPGWGSRKSKNPELIAQAVTDVEGRFTIRGINPDGYTLIGGNNTIGWLYQEIDLEAGKTLDVGVIKLVKL